MLFVAALLCVKTVGPDAIMEGGSPTTSEMIRLHSVPPRHARASPPPLIRDRQVRTVLSSLIVAP